MGKRTIDEWVGVPLMGWYLNEVLLTNEYENSATYGIARKNIKMEDRVNFIDAIRSGKLFRGEGCSYWYEWDGRGVVIQHHPTGVHDCRIDLQFISDTYELKD